MRARQHLPSQNARALPKRRDSTRSVSKVIAGWVSVLGFSAVEPYYNCRCLVSSVKVGVRTYFYERPGYGQPAEHIRGA